MRSSNFDSRFFRDALSQFVTGVTVLATRDEHQHLLGLTVNSFNSVSLDPPLVLWSLSKTSRYLFAFKNASRYSINVLSAGQQSISQAFAKRRVGSLADPTSDPFSTVAHQLSDLGLPIIDDYCAWFECLNHRQYDEGDHVIFVGLVERCKAQHSQRPLVYFNGGYTNLAQDEQAPNHASD